MRLGAMGDVIHTIAAVSSLRSVFPEMCIGWAIEPRWAELLRSPAASASGPRTPARPLVDCVHLVDTKRWRKSLASRSTYREIFSALDGIRDRQYEVVADFQGALKSAVLARLAGARRVLGMATPREPPAAWLYGERIEVRGAHVIEQYLSLAEALSGAVLPGSEARLPADADVERRIRSELESEGMDFILIAPATGWGAKQWPAERFAQVALALSRPGLRLLVNSGPGEEELALQVEQASQGSAKAIRPSISELLALTRHARLVIAGDTGPLHLAAALKIPAVALFGPTDPARNGPWGTPSVVLRSPHSRTSLAHTETPDPGLAEISAEEVIRAARGLLEATHA